MRAFSLPRFLSRILSNTVPEKYRCANVIDGKLYATDGRMLVKFDGYECVPDGPIIKQAVEYIDESRETFDATDEAISVDGATFDRPKYGTPVEYEKPISETNNRIANGKFFTISLDAYLLKTLSKVGGGPQVKIHIPFDHLFVSGKATPLKVDGFCPTGKHLYLSPCRLEQTEVDRNIENSRNVEVFKQEVRP